MENSMAGPQKIKSRITIGSRNSILDIYPKELKLGTLTGICKSKFILALQPRGGAIWCSQKDECIDKMWFIHVTENHSTLKQKVILTHSATQMNLEDTMLREVSQAQKNTYYMIPLT